MPARGVRFRAILTLALLLVAAGCTKRTLPPEAGPPREIDLEGTKNTRDIGGYTTAQGRRVRWGLLYRSDELDDLSDADLQTLRKRGIRRIYDFRTENEKKSAPDRLEPGVEYVALPISYPSMDPGHLRSLILRGGRGEGYFEDLLSRANRSFALDNAPQIATLLEGLTEPGALPALFHCTYGKDRTGFAAALILELLGVPREQASEDYLLSNDYLAAEIDQMSWLIWFGSFFRISRSESKGLLGVKREYLDSAEGAILSEFGSLEAYVRDGLGVPDATVERLRALMLEPADGVATRSRR